MLTLEAKIEIVILMAKFESATTVRRKLKNSNMEFITLPTINTINSIFLKFKKTGTVQNLYKSGRPSLEEEKVDKILEVFENKPKSSIRNVAKEVGVSYGSIQKTIKGCGLYPYKIQLHQKLEDEDYAHRMMMCEDILIKIQNDIRFLDTIIFSDESTFNLNGSVNRHNCRIWSHSKPDEIITKTHSSPKINVWMGLSSSKIYGPFFYEGISF